MKGIISDEEAELIRKAEDARNDAIQVDDFTLDEYMAETVKTPIINKGESEEVVS